MERKTRGVCGFRGPKKRSSDDRVAPESLQEPEEDFFTVVATGNVGALRQFMKKHEKKDGSMDFDVNCVNFQNDNAMTVAVDKGNLEMIKYLVQVMNVTKNSILLKAIHRGDLDLVRGLCESVSGCEDLEDQVSAGETDYPDGVTPLMVAAIEGHYEIVGYLIERGHKIDDPHQLDCMCKACKTISDSLHRASSTYQTYSAISSPAYIPYATADPIHYCFQLHRRLKLLAKADPFRDCYKSLANQVSQFAASLVSECRSSKEMELVLKQTHTRKNTIQSEYPRLHMAIDFNQVYFITQPKVQLFLQKKFYGSFEDWDYFNNFHKLYVIFVRILTAPLAYLSFLINPKSRKSAYYASPINKMLHFLATYLVLLGLLFMEVRQPKPSELNDEMNSIWSVLIFLYFYSFSGLLAYQILNAGLKSFLRYSWNVYDLVMVTVFSLFATFSIASMVHVRMQKDHADIISTERKFWSRFDPQLMAEGFLVIATVMANLKLLFFLQVHRVFGPLELALHQTVKCLAWFGMFAVIVLMGYSAALSHFYSYYSGMSFVDPETKEKSFQEESFTDVLSSFKTFFWGVFGLSHYSAADVILDGNEHMFTELIGYAALGTFLILMILLFKSMLIATAVKCYQDQDVYETWLFERTKIFLYFINMPLLPPPFNMLPHRYKFGTLTEYDMMRDMCDSIADKGNREQTIDNYKELAKALVERYFIAKLKQKERLMKDHSGTKSEDAAKNCQRSRCRSL